MNLSSGAARAVGVGSLSLLAVVALAGCVREPMEVALPALIEERVAGAYDVEFRAAPTASPGLSTIQVSFMLDREPVSAEDLASVIDSVFETNTLFAVHNVSVRAYTENTDDGFGCLDMAAAIRELDLSEHEFTMGDGACTSLLADWDRLEDWWEDR